jgi:hypothetical protein
MVLSYTQYMYIVVFDAHIDGVFHELLELRVYALEALRVVRQLGPVCAGGVGVGVLCVVRCVGCVLSRCVVGRCVGCV